MADDSYRKLQNQIRETPLLERLERIPAMIGGMCSKGRPPKMTIPVQATDEDIFITTTVQDAIAILKSPAHPPPCVAGPFGHSLMLKDGSKVCLVRGHGAEAAHVWLENRQAERIVAWNEDRPAPAANE